MSLAAWQRELTRLVQGGKLEPGVFDAGLDAKEATSLSAIADSTGLAAVRAILRSWCEGRTALGAPLTLGMLPLAMRRRLVSEWVDRGHGYNSFFLEEAPAFLDFVLENLNGKVERAVAVFEKALALARKASAVDGPTGSPGFNVDAFYVWSPDATIVRFPGDAQTILVKALAGEVAQSDEDAPAYLAVGPAVPGLCTPVRPSSALVQGAFAKTKRICGRAFGAMAHENIVAELLQWQILIETA